MALVTLDQQLATSYAGSKTASVSITPSSGANFILVMEANGGSGCGVPSGITFGGNAMTLVPNSSIVATANVEASLWYYLNPATGSSQAASLASLPEFPGGACLAVMSFFNVNTAAPFAGSTAVTNSGTNQGPSTLALSGAVTGQDLYLCEGFFEATSGTDAQTTIWSEQDINSTPYSGFGSSCAASGSGSFSYTWGGTKNFNWATTGIVLKGIAAAAAAVSQMMTGCGH